MDAVNTVNKIIGEEYINKLKEDLDLLDGATDAFDKEKVDKANVIYQKLMNTSPDDKDTLYDLQSCRLTEDPAYHPTCRYMRSNAPV